MSDLLLASEIVYPGAGDALDESDQPIVDRDLLQASRATSDRGAGDWDRVVDWLIERGRWRSEHKQRLQELIFDVWEGLEPPIQRQVRQDVNRDIAS